MLDQQVSLLDPALSIRDDFRALNPAATENDCRAALARMMFRADAALQIVGSLSGGEMLRAALAATTESPNHEMSGILRRRYEVLLRRAESHLANGDATPNDPASPANTPTEDTVRSFP